MGKIVERKTKALKQGGARQLQGRYLKKFNVSSRFAIICRLFLAVWLTKRTLVGPGIKLV